MRKLLMKVGDTKLLLAGILAVSLFAVTPVFADFADFSTDPNLATEWTQFDYYNPAGSDPSAVSATWNSTNQNLDLAMSADRYRGLYKTGATRADTDGVTVTFSNYAGSWLNGDGHNTGVGLIVSSVEQGTILSNVPQYEFLFAQEGGGYHYVILKNGIASIPYNGAIFAELPSTIKLDILRDGSDYVFLANDVELLRDSSIPESMPYYCMTWAVSGTNTLSVSADNFGVVPEPATMGLLLSGAVIGLIRRRK